MTDPKEKMQSKMPMLVYVLLKKILAKRLLLFHVTGNPLGHFGPHKLELFATHRIALTQAVVLCRMLGTGAAGLAVSPSLKATCGMGDHCTIRIYLSSQHANMPYLVGEGSSHESQISYVSLLGMQG